MEQSTLNNPWPAWFINCYVHDVSPLQIYTVIHIGYLSSSNNRDANMLIRGGGEQWLREEKGREGEVGRWGMGEHILINNRTCHAWHHARCNKGRRQCWQGGGGRGRSQEIESKVGGFDQI